MLKLKDNVDLKELEKFGFKPHYDSDTGEISYMYLFKYRQGYFEKRFAQYEIRVGRHWFSCEKTGKLFAKRVLKKCNAFKFIMASDWTDYSMFYDTLFDLIQAGLVEKVE